MDTQPGRILATLTAIALLAACGGGGGHGGGATPPVNSPPVASFTATPASGPAPLTVQFDASASSDPGGSIASYAWNFGDNTATGAGVTASHVYPAGGIYTVTLIATDNVGATGSTTRQITVTIPAPSVVGQTQGAATTAILDAGLAVGTVTGATSTTVPAGSVISQDPVAGTGVTPNSAVSLVVSTGVSGTNLPPVALFTATPNAGALPLPVHFSASASHDSDGSIASYNWNFGDNTGTGSGAQVGHEYRTEGTFTATLTVTDNFGATATHSVQVTVSPIEVTVSVEGSTGGRVGDSVPVRALVRSKYEVRDVIAALAGRQTALTYDAGYFKGTLSLAGEPYGSTYTLSVRATDVRGNVDDDSLVVIHDNPPVLTVVKPLDQSVALGTMPVDIRCTDDRPGCVVEVWTNRVGSLETLLASAPAALATTVDLTEWIGTTVSLALLARDNAGSVELRYLSVYVENPTRLAIVTEVPGPILDADATRLLFREPLATGDRLAIHDRVTNLTETIPVPSGMAVSYYDSYLTPSGAIFLATTGSAYPVTRLQVWRQGALTETTQGSFVSGSTLSVSGNYAIWIGGEYASDFNLYRMNTATGVVTLVSTDAEPPYHSVAADGTVAFSTLSTYQIVRDRDGLQTVLTNDPGYLHEYPLIDGDQISYVRYNWSDVDKPYSLVLIDGANIIPLTDSRTTAPWPRDDYQLNGGWTAYTDLGTQQQLHVFTRSPQGAVTRHTDFDTESRIDRLGGAGEVMILNRNKRYFSRGLGPVEISSEAGEAYWLNGAWYVAIGTTLLAVDTGN